MTALLQILGAFVSLSSQQAAARTDELFRNLNWFSPPRASKVPEGMITPPWMTGHGNDDSTRRSLQTASCANPAVVYDHYYCEEGLVHKAADCDDTCGSCSGSVTTEANHYELLYAKAQWNCSISRMSVACVDDDTIEFYDCATGAVLVEADIDGTVDDTGYCADTGSLETLHGEVCNYERYYCDNSTTGEWTPMLESVCDQYPGDCASWGECRLQANANEIYQTECGPGQGLTTYTCVEEDMWVSFCESGDLLQQISDGRPGACLEGCSSNCHNNIFCDSGEMKVTYDCDPTCCDCLGETISASDSIFLNILGSNCEFSTNNATCDGDTLLLTDCSTGEPVEYEASSFTEDGGYCWNVCEDDLDDGEKFDCSGGGYYCSADDELQLVAMCSPGVCSEAGGFGGDLGSCGFGPVPYGQFRDGPREDLCEDPFLSSAADTLVCVNGTVYAKICSTGELFPLGDTSGVCNDNTQLTSNPEVCVGVPCESDYECGAAFTCACPGATTARRHLLFGAYTEPDTCACNLTES